MSVATRKELLKHIKERYKEAHYRDKGKISNSQKNRDDENRPN